MMAKLQLAVIIIGCLLLLLILMFVVHKKRPKKLRVSAFTAKWKELQLFCRDKATWPKAVLLADKLLDDALKRRRFKGKSMGERMVAAQRIFSDNDTLWYAHNLAKKLQNESTLKLREKEVKNALIGIRQALKDLGALDNGEPSNSK